MCGAVFIVVVSVMIALSDLGSNTNTVQTYSVEKSATQDVEQQPGGVQSDGEQVQQDEHNMNEEREEKEQKQRELRAEEQEQAQQPPRATEPTQQEASLSSLRDSTHTEPTIIDDANREVQQSNPQVKQYQSCEAAEEAGEQRIKGEKGTGRGFPKDMVPSKRDGDKDGIVCEK